MVATVDNVIANIKLIITTFHNIIVINKLITHCTLLLIGLLHNKLKTLMLILCDHRLQCRPILSVFK